jgi:hypothetical protein
MNKNRLYLLFKVYQAGRNSSANRMLPDLLELEEVEA